MFIDVPGLCEEKMPRKERSFETLSDFVKYMRNGTQRYDGGNAESEGRRLDTMGEIDENILENEVESNQRQWSHTPDGTVFWATTDIERQVPPGLYKCIFNDSIGHALQRLLVATDDLIPLPDTAAEMVVQEIEQFWDMETEFTSRGFLHKRGILMYGEPGSGKTAAIQQLVAMIIERGGLAVYAEDPHVLTACLQMLRRVEPERPVIVILEDFETLTDRQQRENEWLSVLDGEAQINKVVFLATTNYIELLDKRFTDRPSRFDTVMAVPMPSARARAVYLAVKEPSLKKDELKEWVEKSQGFSYAHLKEMIISCKCFGKPIDEVVERLREMQKRKFKNEDLAYDPNSKGGRKRMGFVADPDEPPVTDEDLDWDEEWDDDDEDYNDARKNTVEVRSECASLSGCPSPRGLGKD